MSTNINYIGLAEAERLGYGKRDTLQHAVIRGRLKAIKPARDWLVTENWLQEAGYSPNAS